MASSVSNGLNVPDDIAVIGLACRFPGEASNAEKFWDLLCSGRSAWSEANERWNIDAFHYAQKGRLNNSTTRGAHFLEQDISAFDSTFFNITQEEASAMDPQQRFMLEVAYESFENAGLPMEKIDGSKTGCFVGALNADWSEAMSRDVDGAPKYAYTGRSTEFVSARVSWFFNLLGPTLTLNTACSSGLVGLHLACQSLRTGESSMALAGGVNFLLNPDFFLFASNQGFLSGDGKCKTFDAKGDGYGRGEGCAVVVLKRVEDAIRDGDSIRAIIRGTGVNQDGRTKGITLPSASAQASLIESTYNLAGIDMSETSYFEAHGTGTAAGDPLELQAISETLGASRKPGQKLIVGSVKPNVGHLEAVAGLAGVIKGILSLENGIIPPNILFETPNPQIPFEKWNITIPTSMTKWPSSTDRRLSVNAFGAGGTNAHAIIEDAKIYLARRKQRQKANGTANTNGYHILQRTRLFVLTAKDQEALQRQKKSLAAHLRTQTFESDDAISEEQYLLNLSFTLNQRRSRFPWASYAIGSSLKEVCESMEGPDAVSSRSNSAPRIGFVFTGQGAQWPKMGMELCQYKVFKNSIEEADKYFQTLGCPWSILEELMAEGPKSNINNPVYSQPLTAVLQMSLVDLLESWGVRPSAVVGHSSGEVAAAYCVGSLSRADSWKTAYFKGAVLETPVQSLSQKGAMLAAATSEEQAQKYIAAATKGKVVVACINSPSGVTLSGDEEGIDEIQTMLKSESIFERKLKVTQAYHSFHMEAFGPTMTQMLDGLVPQAAHPGRKMYSTVTGKHADASELTTDYWVRNMTHTVQFSDALHNLVRPLDDSQQRSSDNAIDILVEIGPHSTLQGPIGQILKHYGISNIDYRSVIARGKDAVTTSLNCVGSLFAQGTPAALTQVNNDTYQASMGLCQTLTDLPSYQWNHANSLWAEPRLNKELRMRKTARRGLIGAPTPSLSENEHVWRGFIRESEEPWVAHHVIQSSILYPVAGFLAMAIEGACQLADPGRVVSRYRVRDFQIGTPAILTPGEDLEVICSLRPSVTGSLTTSPTWIEFTISTCRRNQTVRQNCGGLILLEYQTPPGTGMAIENEFEAARAKQRFNEIQDSSTMVQEVGAFYKSLAEVGMEYGDTFRNLIAIRSGNNCSSCTLKIGDDGSTFVAPNSERPHVIHPTTLDALLHCIFAATSGNNSIARGGMVPTLVEEMVISADIPYIPGEDLHAYATARKHGFREAVSDIEAFDADLTRHVLTLRGVHFTAIQDLSSELETDGSNGKNICSRISWQPSLSLATPAELQEWVNAIESPIDQITKLINITTHESPESSVLEISTLRSTKSPQIPRHLTEDELQTPSRYVYACPDDETHQSLEQVRAQKSYIDFRVLNFEGEVDQQFLESKFDLIVIRGSLSEQALKKLNSLVKENGKICRATSQPGDDTSDRYFFNVTPHRRVGNGVHNPSGSITIIQSENPSLSSQNFAMELEDELENRYFYVEKVTWNQQLKSLKGRKCIVLLELTSSFFTDLTEEDFEQFKRVVLESSDLLWITSFEGPANAIVTGLARTIRAESAALRFRTVLATPDLFLHPEKHSKLVVRALMATSEESEFQLKDARLEICRLYEAPDMNNDIRGTVEGDVVSKALKESILPLKLGVGSPGMLDTLRFEVDLSLAEELGDDEVELEVKASGVNFRDVMCAMGEIPDDHIGREASGVVVRVGKNVTKFKTGDRVCCLGGGAHATIFRVSEMVCNHIPDHLSFADAASFPVVFCTAFHALVDLMRVQKGDSILIHAAAGGVGQAALQIAKYFELEIFATVGSPDKRNQIQTLYGIPDDHIFNSRDMSFAQGIMRATKGKGVDYILNSLSGEALRQTWNCIADFGTFVEIGIKDILMNSGLDMRPFAQHATFCFFNLEKMQRLKPERLAGIFNRVMEYFQNRIFHPVTPVVTYPVSEMEDGFRLMQAGKHRGKITLSFDSKDVVPVLRSPAGIVKLCADKTYVLVGGFGGLGRSLANLLVDDGAKNLCFLSRSGASTAKSQSLVADLESRGVRVEVIKCDIAEEASLKAALQTCSEGMPAIKGVFQGAMVLRDALFETMNYEQWVQSTRPKIQGTWNLHKYLPFDLDFFITLSSFSGIFGNRGQANYAAGCTFQDSLAHYRHNQGMKAVSIDLGIMRDVGVLAEQGATGTIAAWVEPFGIREEEFHVLINMTIASQLDENWQQSSGAQIVTGIPTGDSATAAGVVPYFLEEDVRFSVIGRRSEIDSNAGKGKSELSTSLASQLGAVGSIQEAKRIVVDAIVAKLTKSLQTSASEIDEMRPLHHYGVDSLVAMEMRNWIVRDLKSEVSLFDILAHTPIVQLAGTIAMGSRVLPQGLRGSE